MHAVALVLGARRRLSPADYVRGTEGTRGTIARRSGLILTTLLVPRPRSAAPRAQRHGYALQYEGTQLFSSIAGAMVL